VPRLHAEGLLISHPEIREEHEGLDEEQRLHPGTRYGGVRDGDENPERPRPERDQQKHIVEHRAQASGQAGGCDQHDIGDP